MTELIWDGKYDKDGKRVAPLRVALPFQTVETVNESTEDRRQHPLFANESPTAHWRNRLIWGDKKYVLPALLAEFAGKVNLIYIDPPFNVGADFSFTATIPDNPETEDDETTTFTKEPSVIEMKAYRDTWGRGLDSYLQWFYETVVMLRELLAENASVYVHLDYHIAHYAKTVLDEVFNQENFLNQIIWKRTHAHGSSEKYGPVHDTILFYGKTESVTWTDLRAPHHPDYIANHFTHLDAGSQRLFQPISLTGAGVRHGDSGKPWRGIDPTRVGRHWALPGPLLVKLGITSGTVQEKLDALDNAGMISWPQKSGGTPRLKQFADALEGAALPDLWTDLPLVSAQAMERLGYPTQKPETVLDRVIRASSNEGDLVLDCFCGSGTTAAVAEKLGRRWIACDLGRFAIHTTRKRLLGVENLRPFVVQNLGKYERQAWQMAEFGEQAEARVLAYRKFILDLYHAQPISAYAYLHGIHHGRMVHVGAVDAPISMGDVTNIVTEFRRAIGTGKDAPTTNGIDVLGWDFAFEINEMAKQQAAKAKVDIRFLRIPHDAMDKRAVEQGDVRFFELAALSVDVKKNKRSVTLTLADFVIPPDDVPQDVQKAITHWSQWIDYWAVDWDNKGDTFHNQWQAYRTRKSRDLERSTSHTYESPGEYMVVVKVIDILGNDTTKAIKIKVGG
ncbi:MAG: DNA methyltransferase [Phycisphaerae bacterium]|nr:DNA methyltransferase [Phycisphaerae bacterium]